MTRTNTGRFTAASRFMERELYRGFYFEVETSRGTEIVPADIFHEYQPTKEDVQLYVEGEVESEPIRKQGWLCRLAAPSYLDCTEWAAFSAKKEAIAYLREIDPPDED